MRTQRLEYRSVWPNFAITIRRINHRKLRAGDIVAKSDSYPSIYGDDMASQALSPAHYRHLAVRVYAMAHTSLLNESQLSSDVGRHPTYSRLSEQGARIRLETHHGMVAGNDNIRFKSSSRLFHSRQSLASCRVPALCHP